MNSKIYIGQTTHQRHEPKRHGFSYPMFWFALDLDELDALSKRVKGFGYNRRNITSLRDSDYGGPDKQPLRDKLFYRLREEGIDQPPARVVLTTIPRFVGYVFNPVSFYLCFNEHGELAAFVAEVRNTFGEMHHYLAKPTQAPADPTRVTFAFPKEFYVSPFLDTDGEYRLTLKFTDDTFDLSIDLHQQGKPVFSATMVGQGKPMTTTTLWATLARLPLFVVLVMVRIQWQALLLRWVKKIHTRKLHAPVHPKTIPYRKKSWVYAIRAKFVAWASKSTQHTPATPNPPQRIEKA